MSGLYSSPLRVYVLLGILALAGIVSAFQLPISLFPNSSKPQVGIWIPYSSYTSEDFYNAFGRDIENEIYQIKTSEISVDQVNADYQRHGVRYEVTYDWGVDAREALRETRAALNQVSSFLPEESRTQMNVWYWAKNTGFLALSFYSRERTLDDLYDLLDPFLRPKLAEVEGAQEAVLWNPTKKEIRIELDATAMANLQLLPRDVEGAIKTALKGHAGGSVTVGTQQLMVQIPKEGLDIEKMREILISAPGNRIVHLTDVAQVDFVERESETRSFKTSGAPSLILWATPRPGGNVKEMSEKILSIVKETLPLLPRDVEFRSLVDPSEFIRAATQNVVLEVALAAFLAVCVLFLFIGRFRNVATAAIEIPMSMLLAFILMRMTGMNLNLISLGGLALSAGMNVDASVVVMENIFRHFEAHAHKNKNPLTSRERLQIVLKAIREIWLPLFTATISSLIVFVPLVFTSDLTYAILGDLAKAVVFSHAFSVFVALLLVPTIRLHILSKSKDQTAAAGAAGRAPITPLFDVLQRGYLYTLEGFVKRPWVRNLSLLALAGFFGFLVTVVLPRLPRELIGVPDSDWIHFSISASGNTMVKQMESEASRVEAEILGKYGDQISYTFNMIRSANRAVLMLRLKDKSQMQEMWKTMEKEYVNTPLLRFSVGPWNPSELPIPDPPHMRLVVRSGDTLEQVEASQLVVDRLREAEVFPNIWSEPDIYQKEQITIEPYLSQWAELRKQGLRIEPSDLADITRVATDGKRVGEITVGTQTTDIFLRYSRDFVSNEEDIASFPIGLGDRLVSLKALAKIGVEPMPPTIYRENREKTYVVFGKERKGEESKAEGSLQKAKQLIQSWDHPFKKLVYFEDAQEELTEALYQVAYSIGLSVLLIFAVLTLQFGSVMNALIVLTSVPLGMIGVLGSLFVFKSTLSLNSALGVILLNGIAVANSIILVDFMRKLYLRGFTPLQATLEAAQKRLRPILMTSLTTILGMLPIALGFGEGGKILQPLGIAVSGGLWFSMLLTLYIVPSLQMSYLQRRSPDSLVESLGDPSRDVHSSIPEPPPFESQGLRTLLDMDDLSAGDEQKGSKKTGGRFKI